MDQYLSFVTLAVPDLAAARRFYIDGLGWRARQDSHDVIFRPGASEIAAGQRREWSGYTGYFADPAGFPWEIAHNPFDPDVAATGQTWAGGQQPQV